MTASKNAVVEDDIFEMEDVLAFRINDNQEQWLVKWKGYDDPSDQTWEPKSNFLNPGAVLQSKLEHFKKEYYEKKAATGNSRKRGATAASATTTRETKSERNRKTRKTVDEEPAPPVSQPEPRKTSPKAKPVPVPRVSVPEENLMGPASSAVVSHIGKGPGNSKDYSVTVKWPNGYEHVFSVSEVREKYSAQLLDYLLSRVRFRDDRHH
eukprot:Gregarina_sp_Pseudo_9__1862@NODE_2272_length_1067_cov_123_774319_g2091_i0_p1_GENE_NODE_2272_length_1067_cov_123_774319_g2091_i0NODE_2272_length_1067_cov_123_774319_g2091_i0_p1_ORF_typecomplete_len209_score10_26Chromo/PF00385_24/3_6e11Chromo/PF00385_24/2_2e03Chromo_shadow/PF01393_19/2_2e02Chromo_shadow/PF01393_19/1_8e04Chromo_shadow/PF01393_19/0_0016UnbV_ASPIC/PF07593_12/0_17_NODE_2272_length_1067_cov_123_774319_g2091_i0366992